MSYRWPPAPMSSLVLSPHFALVWGLVRTWLTLVEDSVLLEGSRLWAHMANAPWQRRFFLPAFTRLLPVHSFGMLLLKKEGLSYRVRFQPQGSEKLL